MKFAVKSLLLISLAATFAQSQTPQNITQIKHVIIVIQENRTPTNLFHEDAPLIARGAHVQPPNDTGSCGPILQNPVKACTAATENTSIPLTGVELPDSPGGDHSHYPAWQCSFDNGAMDGACHISINNPSKAPCYQNNLQYCTYTYALNDTGIMTPYFNIAEQYGFANWMFSTHQGPSQPSHLFLFTGTSAPDAYQGDPGSFWQWWVAENGNGQGCLAKLGASVPELPPAPPQFPVESNGYTPPGGVGAGYPCWNPNTMADLLDQAGLSWRYYDAQDGLSIWNAPVAIEHICQPNGLPGTVCTGTDYINNVRVGNPGLVLEDLGAVKGKPCDLQAVTWVIPDGTWSDHPGNHGMDAGPSWVASIVNGVGGYTNFGAQFPNTCVDDVNGKTTPYWQDTVVLVVWDDWGGFYDDVPPWNCSANGTCTGYPGQSNSADYVYGFRVPLLVVSAWIKAGNGTGTTHGYISGTPAQGGEVVPYVHDFGSILNFIEYTFGQGGQHLGGTGGIGGPNYPHADWFAPDGPNAGCASCVYSLSDFFVDFTKNPIPHPFKLIQGAKYDTNCFLNPTAATCFAGVYPQDPDNDASDEL
jgi:phospholipase C